MRAILSGALLLVSSLLLAQPNSLYQAISYQAVARDANGDPLANQTIGLEFLITAGPGGVYQETQTTTTNDQGLFTVNIGEGTPSGFGPLEEFIWYHPANDLRLFVSADFTGGTNYQFFGEEIIRAVPVAASARMATTLLDSSVVVDRDNGLIEVDPAYDLRVNGSLTYQDGSEGAGKVLVSDSSGGATWSSGILWNYLTTPLQAEFQYNSSPGVPLLGLSIPGIPASARYLLADIFINSAGDDHSVLLIGEASATNPRAWAFPGQQPSSSFLGLPQRSVMIQIDGQGSGQQVYGMWHSSQVVPLDVGGTFNVVQGQGTDAPGWVYLQVRAWSR